MREEGGTIYDGKPDYHDRLGFPLGTVDDLTIYVSTTLRTESRISLNLSGGIEPIGPTEWRVVTGPNATVIHAQLRAVENGNASVVLVFGDYEIPDTLDNRQYVVYERISSAS